MLISPLYTLLSHVGFTLFISSPGWVWDGKHKAHNHPNPMPNNKLA